MKNEKNPIKINHNIIEDAWLNLHGVIDEDKLFNPLLLIPKNRLDLGIAWIFQQPEYFSFLCKYVFNVEILPTQALMLKELWNRKFPMLIASRGFGKSFSLSLYAMMRCLLMPGRKVVIVGAAFRQSKVLFEYMKTIWYNAPVLRSMVSQNSGPTASTDMCKMTINNSTVTCLPLGDGSKIRGQRANDILTDEFGCLSLNTIVETTNGLVRIGDRDQFSTNMELVTGDKEDKIESPSKYIITPPTDVYEIVMRNGYNIKCSKDHMVMTSEGWKTPLELQKGDWLESENHYKFPNKEVDEMDEKLAWLMGLLVSEGYVKNKNYVNITTTDINLKEEIEQQFQCKTYSQEAHIDYRGWNCKKKYTLAIHNTKWRERLYELGLEYVTAHDKKIPWSILQSPKHVVMSFLKGLFEGDGSCFLFSDKSSTNKIGLSYYSVSEVLCRDVQTLINKLGYDSYITHRMSKLSKNKQWMVRLNGIDAYNLAKELNVNRFNVAVDNCILPNKNTNITWDKSRQRWKTSYVYLGKTIQKRFDEINDAEEFVYKLKNNTKYRQIRSITLLPEQEVLYDYYLPKTHSFYGSCFRQHNSIPEAIFETVVAGFASVSASPVENVKRLASHKKSVELGLLEEDESMAYRPQDNQIVICGTADYHFKHFGQYWDKWHQIIRSRGKKSRLQEIFGDDNVPSEFDWRHYSIMRIPYELLPKGFMDAASVARSKATVHSGIYQMEYGAVFSADSNGFFRRSLLERCTPIIENKITICGNDVDFEPVIRGNSSSQHIFGVDPASEIDNFSIMVLEMKADHRRIVFCWTTTRREHKIKVAKGLVRETDFYSYCARKIRDLMKVFPCIHIALDKQGGGVAIMEALHDQDKIQKGEHPIWEVIDSDKEKDTDYFQGLHILELCQFANAEWTGDANHGMRFDFETQVLLFPRFDPASFGLSEAMDEVASASIYDGLEDCVLEIEELKNELSIIEITQTTSGRDKWDTPEYKTDTGKKLRLRKDRYSALLMANKAARDKQRVIPMPDMTSIGGFAERVNVDDQGDGPLYHGPDWFSSAVNAGLYN